MDQNPYQAPSAVDPPSDPGPPPSVSPLRLAYWTIGGVILVAVTIYAWFDDSTDFQGFAALFSLGAFIFCIGHAIWIWLKVRRWKKSSDGLRATRRQV